MALDYVEDIIDSLYSEIEKEVMDVFPDADEEYLCDVCCDIVDNIVDTREVIFNYSDDLWDSLSKELGTGKKWLTEQDKEEIELDKRA